MRKVLIGLGLALLAATGDPARADAPGAKSAESVPASLPETEPAPAGPYGSIVFFPASESRPSDERFRVQAGQEIPVCVRLSAQASAYLEKLSAKAIGFLLILEDSSEPPKRLSIALGNRLQRLKPDASGCFGGEWKLPETAQPSVYQVADLFWAASDESFYSLRNYLYEFQRVEELEVQNPRIDGEAPKLTRIVTYKRPPYKAQFYSGVLRIRFEQGFEFEDKVAGLEKNSLRVFYRVEVDGTTVDLLEAKCKPVPQSKRLRCMMDIANPNILWGLNKVTLHLESLSIRDKAGNALSLKGTEAILAQAPGSTVTVEFSRGKKWPHRPELDLQRDPNVPPQANF